MWVIRQKKDHLAIHGLFDSRDRADRHLRENTPEYVRRGYYTDKTLRTEDFEVHEQPDKPNKKPSRKSSKRSKKCLQNDK